MAITDWPEEERPRERLLIRGAQSLSDAELLAIFLRVGCRGKSAVDLGRDLIARFSSLNRLFTASRSEIAAVPGLGDAKFAQLQAVLEMSRRALKEEIRQGELLNSPQAVGDYLRLSIAHLQHEVFLALWLNAQNRLIACEKLSQGTLSETSVYPREVVKAALQHNASAVIFAHNHPSGNCEPSHADKHLTQALKRALALIEVRVFDHFVIGSGTATMTSFAERGLL